VPQLLLCDVGRNGPELRREWQCQRACINLRAHVQSARFGDRCRRVADPAPASDRAVLPPARMALVCKAWDAGVANQVADPGIAEHAAAKALPFARSDPACICAHAPAARVLQAGALALSLRLVR
jgi:hypothetical protein